MKEPEFDKRLWFLVAFIAVFYASMFGTILILLLKR